MLNFEELIVARRDLQSFCLLHVPSLMSLRSHFNFKLSPTEGDLGDESARHLTTSATCWNSLFDCPPRFRTAEFKGAEDLRRKFAAKALLRPDQDWKSEKSAAVYCRCRALPMVIACSMGPRLDQTIERHIKTILDQLDDRHADRFGIGEADPSEKDEKWYPPNAYHTYWTLDIVNRLKERFPADYENLSQPAVLNVGQKRDGMILWSRQKLGYQIGLHSATPQSSLLDSDQLAWSLAVFMRFDPTMKVDLENRDFLTQALKCLFSTQVDGTWRHYKPLFHYEAVGNAYCYVFETFAALLQCALVDTAEAKMIRELLRLYCKNLMDLWRYADVTKLPLPAPGKGVGWRSGHRINNPQPESWATASVFSYAQALRRLVGIWCREEALKNLNTPLPKRDPEKAPEKMAERGKTWGSLGMPVSERLFTMFVNPARMHDCSDMLEPDSQPIEEHYARSAILFGPPGTSKTTLIRLLADATNWNYVEIHASHFVAEGLMQVQKTADRIFKQLSELDHSVVLFDEIDELVREREMEEDAFGRFLTTSMLPKLAQLWEARKIFYFVATNHINYFDSAIIRSNRFDALILVSPPSFYTKIARLTELLAQPHGLPSVTFQVREEEISDQLTKLGEQLDALRNPQTAGTPSDSEETRIKRWRDQKLDPNLILAKFVLLRFDELDELAYRLAVILKKRTPPAVVVSSEMLRDALKQVADSEWRKNKSYVDYLRDIRSERRDYQMLNVWEVDGDPDISVSDVIKARGKLWLPKTVDSTDDLSIPGFALTFSSQGRVRIRSADAK
jgi:hypothetical protein